MAFGYNAYNPQYYQPTAPQQMQSSPLIWVQGEAGAKSYLVGPGQTVALWDSESTTVYLKSADASGMPSMKILDYTIRGGQQINEHVEYATKADLDELRKKIEELTKENK